MILGFSTHFGDKAKTPTYFPQKILKSFLQEGMRWGAIRSTQNKKTKYYELSGQKYAFYNVQYKSPAKLHTIRWGNRWETGKTIHFATGNRTKDYHCFMVSECTAVQDIQIKFDYENKDCILVWVDNRYIYNDELKELANNDGLTVDQFKDWFWKQTKKGTIPFEGQIIHWTNKTY